MVILCLVDHLIFNKLVLILQRAHFCILYYSKVAKIVEILRIAANITFFILTNITL